MNSKMRAIQIEQPGPEGRLMAAALPIPAPGPGDIRIRVAYAGLNRADLFQVAGQYPAPKESAMVPGMEVSGLVDAVGEGVTDFRTGDAVCALLPGGGYAEYCTVPATLAAPLPAGISMKEAAALLEALLTNWLALVRLGEVQPGDAVLVTGGTSGIGTMAIPLLKELNAHPIALAGSPEKMDICAQLGATPLDYHTANLAEQVKAATDGKGVALVLDMLGGPFIDTAMQALRPGGRLISIAFLQGAAVEVNAVRLLMKNLRWMGMTLRSQPVEAKAAMLTEIRQRLWPALAEGRLRPTLDAVFPLENAQKAHERMQQRLHIGKILLEVGP